MKVSLWLRKAQQGDSASFSKLYEKYNKKVLKRCTSMLKDEDLGQDVASNVWVSVFKKIGTCKGHFSSWLYTIATNSCLEEIRKRKQEKVKNERILKERKSGVASEKLDDLLIAKRDYQAIQRVIETLDEENKEVLILKINGLTNEEVAQKIGISVGAVKSRVHRARARVKKFLGSDRRKVEKPVVKVPQGVCPKCKKEKPLSAEFFHRNKSRKSGFQQYCKECKSKIAKEYHQRPKSKEVKTETQKKYNQRPEVKERRRRYDKEYSQRPEVKEKRKEWMKEYSQRPEVKERRKEYMKEYIHRPEVKEERKRYGKEYSQRPEVKEKAKKYRQKPEVKERKREREKEYSQRPEVKEKKRERMREYNKEYCQRPEVKERRNARRRELRRRKREEAIG